MPNTASAADAALSIDQAVALMDRADTSRAREDERNADRADASAGDAAPDAPNKSAANDLPDADVDASSRAGEPAGDDGADTGEPAADTDAETAEGEGDDSAHGAPQSPRNPPPHWNAEERAVFAKAPPELQDAILAQEGKRETVLQRQKQEAAQARQQAEAERAEVQNRVQYLDALLPHAMQTFQTRWAGIDWSRLPDEVGADQAFKLKAEFDNEVAQIQRLSAEQNRAESDRHRAFVARETEKLRTEVPDLVDPKEGRQRVAALGTFLVREGFPPDRLALMSAKEAAIAYDAMRWRQAEAAAKNKVNKPAQPAPRATVRPTAAQSARSSTTKADDAMKRLARSGRIDDAVAFLNARNS